jgi:hypothetical protein
VGQVKRPLIGGKYRRTTGWLFRYEVRLWDETGGWLRMDSGETYTVTKWGACRAIRQWIERQERDYLQRNSRWSSDCP